MCLGRVSRLSSAHFAISCMQISFLNLLQFVAAAAAASVNGAAAMGWIDSVVVLSYVQHAKRENHQH